MTFTQSHWDGGDDEDDSSSPQNNEDEQRVDPGSDKHSDELLGKVDKDATSEQAL